MTDVFISPEADGEGWCSVRSAYDVGVISIVRESQLRRYDPATKTWWVAEFCLDATIEMLQKHGHRVVRESEPPRPKPRPPDGLSTLDALWVAPDDGFNEDLVAAEILAPIAPELRGRVFRAMARALYPDMYTKGQLR